ncbi:helix-turn-helix domain-containing protein [Pseudomonas sp. CJQ_13]|uniref:helix-turn-helix domain-containing protein n=1 Tax=Pseudomonas sp. CJQ_13 TaxID=3367170 RepID=UPI00370C8F73
MKGLGLCGEYVAPWRAAEILGVSVDTLRHWRYQKKYVDRIPAYYNVSGRVFYRKAEVESFSMVKGCP